VVVAVEESEGLLLEEEEDGVQELEVFGKVVELFKREGVRSNIHGR
jgi:hypothetical protein